MLIQDFFHTSFFSIKQLFFFPSQVSGLNLGEKKEGEWWDISASLWRVKVSLLAWWLVHSADVTWSLSRGSHLPGRSYRGPASLPSSGSCVTGRNHTASPFPSRPAAPPASSIQRASLFRARGKDSGFSPRRDTKPGVWSLWNNENC